MASWRVTPTKSASARARLDEWNADNPGTPIKVTAQQVRKRVAAMRTDKAQRQIKAAPKELRPFLQ